MEWEGALHFCPAESTKTFTLICPPVLGKPACPLWLGHHQIFALSAPPATCCEYTPSGDFFTPASGNIPQTQDYGNTILILSKSNSCIGPTGTMPPHSNLYQLRSCTILVWNLHQTKALHLLIRFLQAMLPTKISTWSLYWAILIKWVFSLTHLLSSFVLCLNHICEECNMRDYFL